MSAPIFRVGKMKAMGRSTPQSVQGHLARTSPTRNADTARTARNVWLVGGPDQDLGAAIRGVMQHAGIDPAGLRKDATIANDILLSISPEWFRPSDPCARGTYDEERLTAFRKEAERFLRRFGARLVTAVLHLDESTPHVQAVVVPVLRGKDNQGWRLSGSDMFDPAGLRALQQAWEDHMAPHGVGKRIRGSTARHNPIERFYAALDGFGEVDPVPALTLTDPPPRKLLEGSQSHSSRVGDWKVGEERRIRQKLTPLTIEAAKGRLYEAERRAADQLRGQVREQRHELIQARQEVALTKEEIAVLRRAPLNQVVAMLGYTGPVGPRENAIDVVRRVGDLDFNNAVAWLAQRFSVDVATTAVREAAERHVVAAAAGPVVLTKAERTKRQLVARQLDAVAAPAYRITTMFVKDGKKIAKNFGKSKQEEGEEYFYTKQEVLDLIPDLTNENYANRNVFVTPIDPHAWHIVVDDVKPNGLQSLAQRGFTPSVVVETSPSNYQAVLKIPKIETTPFESVNEVFKDLNRDLGDQRITALTHAFRLAGFENRKDKYRNEEGRYPWVNLAIAVNQMCRKTLALALEYARPAPVEQTELYGVTSPRS